ncbi:S9 family peptidase [Tersicoccus sp. Bi-70]|uniref:S9 family peptidase n=1 Tax=Tersicoccus sp. Bi-70 TaxID=1897634 RepID=UPI0009758187|nr:S9 family peptidase [Tersicoccus sp. Bi-70]OMH31283.1 oligopeptidase B [Tersicoccus sp. Bi-70]
MTDHSAPTPADGTTPAPGSATLPAAALPPAPVARKIPKERTHHGDTLVDDYEWLREKTDPEVLAHLTAENAYTDAVTAGQQRLRERIFDEIKGRTQETDLSVPSRRHGWWYYSRTVEGGQHAVHCRVAAEGDGTELSHWEPPVIEPGQPLDGEQVLLDGNAEADGLPFFSLGSFAVSEDGGLLAYGVDSAGDERFTIRVKDLRTGEALPDVIEDTFYDAQFHPDGRSLYYTVVDAAWRPHELRRHVLGTPSSADEVVAREDDPGLWLGAEISSNRRWLIVTSGNSEYSESRVQRLDTSDGDDAGFQIVIDRADRVLYDVEPVLLDGRDQFVLLHNRDAVNSAIALMDPADAGRPVAEQTWTPVIEHRDTVRLSGIASNRTHLFVAARMDTTERVQVLELAGLGTAQQRPATEPRFEEELYSASLVGAEFEAPVARITYTSFLTPPRVYDYFPALDGAGDGAGESAGDSAALALALRKETPVLGGYDPTAYRAERAWATARDGVRIPVSIVRRADVEPDGRNPVIQYGYGSYEISIDPSFSVARLSLLDRGVVFVVAHVRGGGELGRPWYEDGKKLAKRHSFTDFVDVTDFLVDSGWADPARIVATGGSAGGLLMGAVANLAPTRYRAIVAVVPFVDALTTILDPELPLSALEWEEWGNPITDPEVYAYMRGYSPYENIAPVAYPKIAAITSLNDTRVFYVEPAKWVARLREIGTGSEPIILKTEMDGGHGGASGRYEKWKDTAFQYAFMLDALGVA